MRRWVSRAVRYRGDDLIATRSYYYTRMIMRPRRLRHPRHPRRRRRRLRHPYHFISSGTAVCTVSAKSRRHSPPSVFSRRARVAVQLFRCRRIAWLPSCCRRLDVAAVLGHAKTIISGHEEQVPAVSRVTAFGFTSSDAHKVALVELIRQDTGHVNAIF